MMVMILTSVILVVIGYLIGRAWPIKDESEDLRVFVAGVGCLAQGWRCEPWTEDHEYAWMGRHPLMLDVGRLRRAAEILAGEDCTVLTNAFNRVEEEEASGRSPVHTKIVWAHQRPEHPEYDEYQRVLADLKARGLDEH